MNHQAIDKGMEALVKIDVPAHWADAQEEQEAAATTEAPEFVQKVLETNKQTRRRQTAGSAHS